MVKNHCVSSFSLMATATVTLLLGSVPLYAGFFFRKRRTYSKNLPN
uniref:Beta-lactamase CTX-M-1 n=1 Tax=Escherichia coli TaxID=562 RepID=A0A3G4RTF0_ECOLX|nr:Beta-lactamase CTX-M-1 precursor [Escherichia coli]